MHVLRTENGKGHIESGAAAIAMGAQRTVVTDQDGISATRTHRLAVGKGGEERRLGQVLVDLKNVTVQYRERKVRPCAISGYPLSRSSCFRII
jgi:hypothetical protein